MKNLSEINFGRRAANRKPNRQVNIIVQKVAAYEWSVKVVEHSVLTIYLPDFDTRWQARDIAGHLAIIYRENARTDVVLDLSGKH